MDLYGLIHHVTMTSNFKSLANFEHDSCFSEYDGDGSWANPLEKESANAVYVEENIFTFLPFDPCMQRPSQPTHIFSDSALSPWIQRPFGT